MSARRVRVAQVVTRFIAGAGGVALRGAIELDRQRFDPVILTAPGGPLAERASAAGIEVLTLRHMRPDIAPGDDAAGVRELMRLFEVAGFDLVHTHSAKAGAIGRIAARRSGVPAVVHTFHGFPFHPFQSRLRRAAYVALERKLGRITDRFVAVSSGVAAEAVRRRIAPPDRIRVIPVSISAAPAGGPGARARARRLLGFPDHATLLGSVGRLDHQKAPGDFLRAVAALPRLVQAVWIGGGPLRRQVEAERRRLGLQDRVRLLGERDDVGELLPGLDVFLMTSLYEGLPCALLEAMAAGVPVVATAVNGVPEAVVAGVTGLLAPPADPAACAHAVRHLLDHPADAERMAAAARQAVAGRFTPAAAGAALERLYLDALGAEPAALEPVPRAS